MHLLFASFEKAKGRRTSGLANPFPPYIHSPARKALAQGAV
ncbi:Hypothetical protein AA314_04776 [Archangium gephyra]|uniref:Uncharacterized protein n=1 Tax=Archangium gephyra TaxID=48 RepID=A0AAC8TEP2_9BACT|nr:Hypothetical protein AA314_04776 [Archangium gephyra]